MIRGTPRTLHRQAQSQHGNLMKDPILVANIIVGASPYGTLCVHCHQTGQVSAEAVKAAIQPDTILVTVMHSNNELGTLQPIADIVEACRSAPHCIVVHTDASQSIGKVTVDVRALGVDLVTIAGHKLYAPKGIGALIVGDRARPHLQPILHGAPQEKGIRPGTENVMYAVGLGEACRLAHEMLCTATGATGEDLHSSHLRALFLSTLTRRLGHATHVRVNGHAVERLPNTLNISITGVPSAVLLPRIAARVACSAGAACHSQPSGAAPDAAPHVSATLRAIHMPLAQCLETIRVSTGRFLTEADAVRGAEIMADAALAILQEESQ
eukprot:TRINITY_DN5074_c0_g1_i2.p1 TRINITY_DN5074_c0_g1~~TRINITY_DN5074_c0_g1_i2.p1  ORF type:complete len:326 (-),score=52.42 TRINITY_DN5074_c0_g1_i2:49-1026(-)